MHNLVREKIKATVTEALIDILQLEPNHPIEEEMSLREGLGVDSLDTVELLMVAEDTYDIEIDASDVDPTKVVTVRDMIEFVVERVAQKEV